MTALYSIQRTLHKQGIPAANVNFIPIPINLPLFMGYGSEYDTFNLVMRMALPSGSGPPMPWRRSSGSTWSKLAGSPRPTITLAA